MTRLITSSLLVGLLALVASACSSTADALPPMEAIESAAAQAQEEDTFAFELEFTMEPDETGSDDDDGGFGGLFGGNMEMTAEGRFDMANDRAYFAANLVLIEIETITDGDVCYTRSNWTGEKWQKEDPCENTEVMEGDEDSPIGDPFSDPAGFVESLQANAASVEDMGEAEVRGETVRHLRVELTGEDFEELEGGKLPMDVYLDDENRVVRLETEFRTPDEGMMDMGGEGGEEPGMVTITMTMDFFDYGEPVDIEIPSEDEIGEAEDFFGGFDEEE
ncbi:MAG: hypothetical protein U5Q44_04555 [Dehalococcoidia bacterium]|nr:hypothetical protein [Dehalococcoidia bacterium]